MNMVELVRIAGATSVCIDAEITDNGDLQIPGQDIGAALQETFGDVLAENCRGRQGPAAPGSSNSNTQVMPRLFRS
jgi:hypothetical protein